MPRCANFLDPDVAWITGMLQRPSNLGGTLQDHSTPVANIRHDDNIRGHQVPLNKSKQESENKRTSFLFKLLGGAWYYFGFCDKFV